MDAMLDAMQCIGGRQCWGGNGDIESELDNNSKARPTPKRQASRPALPCLGKHDVRTALTAALP
jgi:hypothetical protein